MEVELLTLQIRLVICSVDKAKELGIDWWVANPAFSPQAPSEELAASLNKIDDALGTPGIRHGRGQPLSSLATSGTCSGERVTPATAQVPRPQPGSGIRPPQ